MELLKSCLDATGCIKVFNDYFSIQCFCKEQNGSVSKVFKLRASDGDTRGRNRCVLSLFHNLGGIFQIRRCSIMYRCTSLSSAFTEIFVQCVKIIQMSDPPWKAVNVSVFVVAEVQVLLA